MRKLQNHFRNFYQKSFFKQRVIFFEAAPNGQETIDNPEQVFKEVNQSFQKFDVEHSESIQAQLNKYSDTWVNSLSPENKAEAMRQWAYCLINKLRVQRADEHKNDHGLGAILAIKSPKSIREYGENKSVIEEVQKKLKYAALNGNETTKTKASSLLDMVNQLIILPPEIEQREKFKLTDYFKVDSKHDGWNVDTIQISLTESEERALQQAAQEGYSMVTEGNFNGKAGGNLVLYKNGKPVEPKKTFNVSALFNTIVGFSIK